MMLLTAPMRNSGITSPDIRNRLTEAIGDPGDPHVWDIRGELLDTVNRAAGGVRPAKNLHLDTVLRVLGTAIPRPPKRGLDDVTAERLLDRWLGEPSRADERLFHTASLEIGPLATEFEAWRRKERWQQFARQLQVMEEDAKQAFETAQQEEIPPAQNNQARTAPDFQTLVQLWEAETLKTYYANKKDLMGTLNKLNPCGLSVSEGHVQEHLWRRSLIRPAEPERPAKMTWLKGWDALEVAVQALHPDLSTKEAQTLLLAAMGCDVPPLDNQNGHIDPEQLNNIHGLIERALTMEWQLLTAQAEKHVQLTAETPRSRSPKPHARDTSRSASPPRISAHGPTQLDAGPAAPSRPLTVQWWLDTREQPSPCTGAT
jgi:hypothetical protein